MIYKDISVDTSITRRTIECLDTHNAAKAAGLADESATIATPAVSAEAGTAGVEETATISSAPGGCWRKATFG